MQDLKYYEDKATDAQIRLDALESGGLENPDGDYYKGFFILPMAYAYDFVYCLNGVTNTTMTYPEGTKC